MSLSRFARSSLPACRLFEGDAIRRRIQFDQKIAGLPACAWKRECAAFAGEWRRWSGGKRFVESFISRYFLISPTVSWRIFDAGRIISNVGLQKANRSEAIYAYRNTVLTAFREVEDALVIYAREQERRNSLAEALAQTRESLSLIRNQYEHGLATFIDVLDAQRNVLTTEDQLAVSDQALTTDLVSLYKALGGGWGGGANSVGVNTP